MPFDPNKPYEVVEDSAVNASTSSFDPSKPFEVVADSAVEPTKEELTRQGIDLAREKGQGPVAAFAKGAIQEGTWGFGAEAPAALDALAGKDYQTQKNMYKAEQLAAQEEHPYLYGAGRVFGFVGGLGGKLVTKIGEKVTTKILGKAATEKILKYGAEGLAKYIPKVNWPAFRNLIKRSILEGAVSIGTYEGVGRGAKAAVEGQPIGTVAKETGIGALEGGFMGAMGGAAAPPILGAGYMAGKAVTRIPLKSAQITTKLLGKVSQQAKDINYQLNNLETINALKSEEARSAVFAKEAKVINDAKNRFLDKTEMQIDNIKKMTKNTINEYKNQSEMAIKSESSKVQAVADKLKYNATKKLIKEKDAARERLSDYYGKEAKRIMNEPIGNGKTVKDLPVDLKQVRNDVIDYLSEQNAIVTESNAAQGQIGDIIPNSPYALSNPKEANEMIKIYNWLNGRSTLLRNELDSDVSKSLQESIFKKREISRAANFSKAATKDTAKARNIYNKLRVATETTEPRLAPLNNSYYKGLEAIDDMVDLVKNDRSIEGFISRTANENSMITKEELRALKGKISGEVDSAIDDVFNFLKTTKKAKAIADTKLKLSDEQILSKVLETSKNLKEAMDRQAGLEEIKKTITDTLGGRKLNPQRMDKLLREIADIRRVNGSVYDYVEKTMDMIPNAREAFLRTAPARIATRLFDGLKTGLLGFQSALPQARFVLLNWEVIASRIINTMYRASESKIIKLLRVAPEQVQRMAEMNGPRYAFVLWMQRKNGQKEIQAALDVYDKHESVEDDETMQVNNQVNVGGIRQ